MFVIRAERARAVDRYFMMMVVQRELFVLESQYGQERQGHEKGLYTKAICYPART